MKRVVVMAETGAPLEAALGALSAAGFEAQSAAGADAARSLVEAGAIAVVLIASAASTVDAAAAQAFATLPPGPRRGLVIALIGANLTTGDGVRAFLLNADLVVATADLTRLGDLLAGALAVKRGLVAGLDPAAAARLGG